MQPAEKSISQPATCWVLRFVKQAQFALERLPSPVGQTGSSKSQAPSTSEDPGPTRPEAELTSSVTTLRSRTGQTSTHRGRRGVAKSESAATDSVKATRRPPKPLFCTQTVASRQMHSKQGMAVKSSSSRNKPPRCTAKSQPAAAKWAATAASWKPRAAAISMFDKHPRWAAVANGLSTPTTYPSLPTRNVAVRLNASTMVYRKKISTVQSFW